VIGGEEPVEAEALRLSGEAQDVVVAGTLLGFDQEA